MSAGILQFDSVTLARGKRVILKDLSFQLERGVFLGIIGPNGVGKSTLVSAITGFLPQSKGKILIENRHLDHFRPKERARMVALVAQEQSSEVSCKVSALLEMGRYCHNKELEELSLSDREVVDRYARYCQVEEFLDRDFNTLSGGEKQRVLFARALIQEAQILLLDEPSSNLDMAHEHTLFAMAKEYAREGKLVISVIHDVNIALEYCSHLMVLHEQSVYAFGPTQDILSKETIERVFKMPVQLAINQHTGSRMIVHAPLYAMHKQKKIHLIGGAGSAINLTRLLVQEGYSVTGGIAHGLDSDSQLWESLEIEHVRVDPFAPIDDASFERGRSLVNAADLTILCDFPFGLGNMRNLELAREAKKLIIVEGGGGSCTREFWLDGLKEIFGELCDLPSATVLGYFDCVNLLKEIY